MISKVTKKLTNIFCEINKLDISNLRKCVLFLDYVFERCCHGMRVSEYFNSYKLYKLSRLGRREYISISDFDKLSEKLNYGRIQYFDDKEAFLLQNKQFVHREWLPSGCSEDSFVAFASRNKYFVSKPRAGSYGIGVKVFHTENCSETDLRRLFSCSLDGVALVEEFVKSCRELSEFHPESLNTIRVVTFTTSNGLVKPIGAAFRIGCGNSVVDNMHSGGLYAQIDLKTGVVITRAETVAGKKFICHPDSGKQILGFKIPCFDKIIEYSMKYAEANPKARIAGWDIALNSDYEPELIEGNCTPDIDLLQSDVHGGLRKVILALCKE